jgi:hypothetical protein
MYIGLVLLTIGLFQMAFIDTDGLILSLNENFSRRIQFFQDQNLYPLFRVNILIEVKSSNFFF